LSPILGAMRRTRIAVLDDHPAVRLGLERLLRREPGFGPVAAVGSERDLMQVVAREDVDVAVLDYGLADGDGLAVCQRLKQRARPPRVVVYSAYAGPGMMVPAAIAQADAVVGKAEPVGVLLDAIRRVARGERLLPPPRPELLEAAGARLGVDDAPVVAMLLAGASMGEIARTLALDEAAVVRRARRIIGRLTAGSRPPGDGAATPSPSRPAHRTLATPRRGGGR
jgi:DNA-binding NarL/FixJ family response regulator